MERAKRLPEAAPHCCAATSGRVISARKCAPSNSRYLPWQGGALPIELRSLAKKVAMNFKFAPAVNALPNKLLSEI